MKDIALIVYGGIEHTVAHTTIQIIGLKFVPLYLSH